MRSGARFALLGGTLLLAACGAEGEAEVPAAVAEGRALAARQACIAQELLNGGREELATVEATVGVSGPVANAATQFSRAFVQHAELRLAALAQLDSARNHSPTEADSARHHQAAASVVLVPPEPGTVEANVYADYEREAATILADSDHPCNWRHELEAE